MYEIEKSIPFPHEAKKYPFDEMDVGDSFFVPNKKSGAISGSKQIAQRRTGFKFVCRNVDGGVRVWRVK